MAPTASRRMSSAAMMMSTAFRTADKILGPCGGPKGCSSSAGVKLTRSALPGAPGGDHIDGRIQGGQASK